MVQLYTKRCVVWWILLYIFFVTTYRQNSVITKLFHSYTETYVKMSHVTFLEILLLPCQKIIPYCHVGFLKLLYLNFKAFQSKLDIDTIVFCFKNAEDNSVIFTVGINSISYFKAHFKTTTTMVSTNFKMNFIFNEWVIDEHIVSKKKGKLSKLKVIHWQCLPKVVVFQSPTLPKIYNCSNWDYSRSAM